MEEFFQHDIVRVNIPLAIGWKTNPQFFPLVFLSYCESAF